MRKQITAVNIASTVQFVIEFDPAETTYKSLSDQLREMCGVTIDPRAISRCINKKPGGVVSNNHHLSVLFVDEEKAPEESQFEELDTSGPTTYVLVTHPTPEQSSLNKGREIIRFSGSLQIHEVMEKFSQATGSFWGKRPVENVMGGGYSNGCRVWVDHIWDNRNVDPSDDVSEPEPDPEEELIREAPATTVTVQEKTTVFITTRREFIHRFPGAATIPELCDGGPLDVSFLADPHRHMWGFRVETNVFHDDRDIEFIQLKRTLEQYLDELPRDLGALSCEQFAKAIITRMTQRWGVRYWKVEVNEDQENGAIVESTPVQ